MKKLLLIAVAVILFTACSKKNNPGPSITGKWYAKADTIREYQDDVLTETDFVTFNHTDYIQFNADLSGTVVNNGDLSTFTYTLSGGVITASIPQDPVNGVPKPPLKETIAIKVLTANNLTLNSVLLLSFGTAVVFKETENESFER